MSGLINEPLREAGRPLKVLFISRVAKQKGVLDSIEAVLALRRKGIQVSLRVAGTGDDLEEAKRLSARHGLGDVVEFTGFIAGDDRIAAYRSSDLLLFPTYWNEGFPYVVLEAMAAGLPIVSTTHGVMPHLLKDGVNGYLAEPRNPAALAEKIEKIVLDPKLRIEIGRNNRREVQGLYGIEEATRAYGRLYAELLAGTAGLGGR
jgi:glycosyltransferase involved in cell wall biosynthesis